jgi:hypothetical protein
MVAALRLGMIAGAATTGALVGIGWRAGTPARPLNVIASHVLGNETAGVFGFSAWTTIVGAAVHILSIIGASLVALYLSERHRLRPLVSAVIVSAIGFAFSVALAKWGGRGLASLLPIADVLVLYVTLSVALVVGIRLAFAHVDDLRRDAREM